jgi:hypothetical protein
VNRPHLDSYSVFVCGLLTIAMYGCTTTEKAPEAPSAPPPPSVLAPGERPSPDLKLLQNQLNMDRNVRELGFEEHAFNPCDYNLATPPACRAQRLAVVHFRLECRNTQGTAATVESYVTQPINTNGIRWKIGQLEGTTDTDFEGFGQIRVLAFTPQKKSKLRLTLNGKYLIMTVGDISRVVVPGDWCPR